MDAKEIDHFNLLKTVCANYKNMPKTSENKIDDTFSPTIVAQLDLTAADVLELQILLGAEYRVNESNYTAPKKDQMTQLIQRVNQIKV